VVLCESAFDIEPPLQATVLTITSETAVPYSNLLAPDARTPQE
jgi:hypothetical protein